ncbi:MAG: S49 family peptidase, partial [Pyrinomonadaceae bacterium]
MDKRIGAVLLNFDSLDIGWGKADELRSALADLRQSKKPVYAYMEYGSNREYYIATACDRIYVAPIGDLFITGFAAEVTFYRGALDKLGVYPDVYQIGKYKNLPDKFTRTEMSDAQREVINATLDDLFIRYVGAIATARNRTPEQVKALIDTAPLDAKTAQAEGLIDGAKYRDEVDDELKQKLGYKSDTSLNLVGYSTYRRIKPESLGLDNGDQIAIVFASGPIASGQSYNAPLFGQSVGSDTIVKAIKDASENKKVKAIVLRVDSPGGTTYASGVIWHAIEEAKKTKSVVVSMSDVAASGGYYISTNANRIIAEPSTITGSIGIFAGKPVLKGFYDLIGVNNEY